MIKIKFNHKSNRFRLILIILLLIFIASYCLSNLKIKETISLLNGISIKHESSYVTVVSCYFLLNKSKHDGEKYSRWLRNFFLSVSSPLVLFTSNQSIDSNLLKLRENLTTKIYFYESNWDLLKEIELKTNQSYIQNYKTNQYALDPEKYIHNSDLYSIWNTKSYILNKVAEENPFGSTMFIYTDSGAWRDKPLYNWPNLTFVKDLSERLLKDKMLFVQISNSDLENDVKFPSVDIIEATFFMGSKLAVYEFNKEFWSIHDKRIASNLFIGKEQDTLNLVNFKSRLARNESFRLQTWNLNCNMFVDIWFFYQYFLANDEYYNCATPKESLIIQ